MKQYSIKSPLSVRLVYAMSLHEAKCYARMLDKFAMPLTDYVAI